MKAPLPRLAEAADASPVLTLGRGTRINCRSQRMAERMTAAFAAIGVPGEGSGGGRGELPAIRVQAPCEVHFERGAEVAFS